MKNSNLKMLFNEPRNINKIEVNKTDNYLPVINQIRSKSLDNIFNFQKSNKRRMNLYDQELNSEYENLFFTNQKPNRLCYDMASFINNHKDINPQDTNQKPCVDMASFMNNHEDINPLNINQKPDKLCADMTGSINNCKDINPLNTNQKPDNIDISDTNQEYEKHLSYASSEQEIMSSDNINEDQDKSFSLKNKQQNNVNLENDKLAENSDLLYSSLGEYIDDDDQTDNNFIARFKIDRSLGTGSSCRVRLGIDPKTGERVAIKIIERETSFENRVYREALISSLLCHPHIVSLRYFYFSNTHFYLIFEYISGVQLLDLVIQKGALSEKTSRRFFRQISSAVTYIHSNKIAHRDLKIENILVDEHGSIKIIDFGLSNFYEQKRFLSTFCGSLYFAAPELLNGTKYIGPEIDVWSLGIVLYVLLHGQVPFDDAEISDLHEKIMKVNFEISSSISDEGQALLKGMICKNSLQRYSMKVVNSHSWVNHGFSSGINDFTCERKPITKLDTNLMNMLSTVCREQFPDFYAEIQRYYTACINKNAYQIDYYGKKPTVSLYYLILEKLDSNKIDINNFKNDISMYNFVSFVQSRSLSSSKCFLGAVFKESRVENAKTIQRCTPNIKSAFIKWMFKGISIKRMKCEYELREWTDCLLEELKIIYEIKERYYLCLFETCNFKISLYKNMILKTFFLSITRLNGCKNRFYDIMKEIKRAAKNFQ